MSDQLLCTDWLSENIVNSRKSMDTCIVETENHPEFLSKKVIQTMRKRKLWQKFERILRKSTLTSSKLFHLLTNYKLWYTDYTHGNLHSFYTAYFQSQLWHARKNYWKNIKSKQYSVSDMKVLLSDDIETNTGPIENVVSNSISFFPQNSMLLATRLYRHGLRPLDIGEGGDCFFWAVAHQLYGDQISFEY